jgi:hypothetical protein
VIREYAVDPDAAYRNLDSLQRFFGEFRADKGRVIAGFPNGWKRVQQDKVRDMGLSTITRRNCFEELNQIEKTSLTSSFTQPRQELWLDRALNVDGQCSLTGIMTLEAEPARKIYCYGNLLEAKPELWEIGQSRSVVRQAEVMANTIGFSLSIASTAMLVDPYFHPTDERYRAPLRSFINKITTGRHGLRKLFLHIALQGDKTRREVERGLEEHIKPILPHGFTIETWIWPSNLMHDRFVLTKNVGYSFGHGLDENTYQNAIEVNVHRLSEDHRKEHFRKFSTEANRQGAEILTVGV